ncbi:MAG: HupE/UreJ family protein, partial [Gemmatimonadetes bacterium]|nr:HupE/UreJ family protein [Gemmatimonadota bacterium]
MTVSPVVALVLSLPVAFSGLPERDAAGDAGPVPAAAAGIGAVGVAAAHAVGEDYVWVTFGETSIEGMFEVNLEDLEEKLGLDLGGDPTSVLDRVNATAARVEDYIRANFAIGPPDSAPYAIEFGERDLTELPQGTFAQYRFRIETGAPLPDSLQLRHDMFYEGDKLHRGLLLIEYNAKTDTEYPPEYTALVFSPMNKEQVLDLLNIPGLMSPRDMIPQGVLHIWIGIDHILFLLALILPTVLTLRSDGWKPVEKFSSAFWNLLKIVTVFTIAHSVTLGLAALDLISVPSRFVESVIALSIVLVALNNISPRVKEGSL